MKFLPIALIAALLGACSAPVKAPSAAFVQERASRIGNHVTSARNASESGQKSNESAKVSVQAGQVKTKSVEESIEGARLSLKNHDYSSTDDFLVKAKIDNEVAISQFDQTYRDLVSTTDSFNRVTLELSGAEVENENLKVQTRDFQKILDQSAANAGKDHEIARRVNSWFGLGALFYGVERLLKTGIIGILLFAVVIIVLLAIGGPTAAFVLVWLKKLWGMVFRR